MSNSGVQVIVIGGGLGGLCLAQGLRQAGVHVAVYERDPAADFRSQGYRIGINADGRRALADCLPPKLFELFLATTSRPSNGMVILSAQSKEMVVRPDAGDAASPETFAANVNRLTLREILLAGLDDAVHFSKTFTHFEQGVDGGVRAWFADGSSVRGDVLVAADGVHSAIRQQLLPHAQVVDAGARVVFGKTPLTHESLSWIPPQLLERFTLAIGPNSRALALGAFRPVRPPADAAAELWPGLRLTDSPEYLMWTFGAAAQDFPLTDVELAAADGSALMQLTLDLIDGWHPDFRRLVAAADPAAVVPLFMRTSLPLEPWETTNVTLLGDAIHAMTPVGGYGANMALRDANLLCRKLAEAGGGQTPLLTALGAYEAEMRRYGFEAVLASQRGGEQLLQLSEAMAADAP